MAQPHAPLPVETNGPGQPVWSSVSETVSDATHRGWEGMPFLVVTLHVRVSAMYARDVDGLIGTSPSFRTDVTLPSDAIFTGWRNGDRELWADARLDRRGVPVSIYIVSSTGVERWPQGMGCVWRATWTDRLTMCWHRWLMTTFVALGSADALDHMAVRRGPERRDAVDPIADRRGRRVDAGSRARAQTGCCGR